MIITRSKQLSCHTYLWEIFKWLHGYHIPLNWMITDLECNYTLQEFNTEEPICITGHELNTLIEKHKDLQIIWGVFSGIRLDLEDFDISVLPYADGNKSLWSKGYNIQHPQAECELISWDSTSTIFISKNSKAMKIFKMHFPEAIDFDEYKLR